MKMQQKLCRFFDRHTALNCLVSFFAIPLFLVGTVSAITLSVACLFEGIKNLCFF